jgi:uncharacterized protein involved in outer membrane biogenesis
MSQIKLKIDPTSTMSRSTKLIRAGLFLIFLLLVAYFVLTSSWFLQSVIVPRIGRAMNCTLSVGDLEVRPFSEVTLTQIKLTPNGADTLFEAKRVYARYKLTSILRGHILVDDLVLDSPTINIVEDARGKRNLDVLTGSSGEKKSTAKAGQPPQLDVRSVTLRNAVIRHTRSQRNGDKVTTELANVNLSVKDVKNGGSGTLTCSAALGMEKATATPAVTAKLPALLNADLSFGLGNDLQLASIKGLASFTVGRATGEFADLGGLIAKLDCEMSPTEIKKFALQFLKGNAALGRVQVSGPFDTDKTEGKLKLEVLAIDRQVLNLFGAPRGIDFGTTTINDTTDITIAQAGRMVSLAGSVQVGKLQAIQRGQTSPTVDLTCQYDLTLDRVGKSLLLKSLNLNGTQNQQPLATATLSNPLTIAFGDTVNAADASLDFVLSNLNLADWQAFAPGLDLAGVASANGRVVSKDGGKLLSIEVEKRIRGFSAKLGGGPTAVDEISFKGLVNHTAQGDSIKCALTFAGIKLAGVPGSPLQAAVDIDTGVSNHVAELHRCLLKLTSTARAKNELVLTGRVDLTTPDAISGNLNLSAESLDLTGYYDLFASKSTPAATDAASPKPGPAANQEPAAVTLPFNNFTVEANIGRLYLHDVDAANFQTTLLLDGSHVVLKPFQLTLNNAPVSASAEFDLSVPGYRYALAFAADGVPVAPLADTFSPTYRGQAQGTLLATLDLRGAGITGPNLRTNLSGAASFIFTNANIQIVGPKLKAVLEPVSLVLKTFGVPDLLRSPLDHINASLQAKDGKLEIPGFTAQSPLFRADSAGSIPIADVLTESPLNQPVEISLARDIAAKVGMSNISSNEPYAKLPTFVHLNGTLGKPGSKTDKAKLAGLVASGIGAALLKNVGGETGQKTGGALTTLGELLGGKPAATNAAPAAGTNAPAPNATNKPSVIDALRNLTR